jgi:hypothetical protein
VIIIIQVGFAAAMIVSGDHLDVDIVELEHVEVGPAGI